MYLRELLTNCLSNPEMSQLSTLLQQYSSLSSDIPSHQSSALKLQDYEVHYNYILHVFILHVYIVLEEITC